MSFSEDLKQFGRELKQFLDGIFDFIWAPSCSYVYHPITTIGADSIQWEGKGIFLGGVRFPIEVDAHYLFMGTTRSGKTTALRIAIRDAFADILDPAKNTRALVYDPKREMLGILHGMGLGSLTITLDPFHPDSFAPDFAKLIKDHRGAKRFAASLTPNRTSKDGTDHFQAALRALIESVVIALVDRHKSTGRRWSLWTVLRIMEDERLLRAVAGRHEKGRRDIESFLDGRKDLTHDLRAVTRTYLGDYEIIANLWRRNEREGRIISLDDWLTSNRILVLPAPPVTQDGDPYDPVSQLNRLIFGEAATLILQQPESRTLPTPSRTWMVLDEARFAAAGNSLPGLLQLLTAGASKGARLMIVAQNYPGLRDALGHDRAAEVLDLCSIKAFFKAGEKDTADVMAAQFGSIRERVPSTSFGPGGRTQTEAEQDRPVLLDIDFLNLPLPNYDSTGNNTNCLAVYCRTAGLAGPNLSIYSELPMDRIYGPNGILAPIEPGHDCRERPSEHQQSIPLSDEERRDLLGECDNARAVKPRAIISKLPAGSTNHLFRAANERSSS